MRRTAVVFAAARASGLERSVLLVRHGVSEINVALAKQPWGSPNFVDPDIRDAPLTAEGAAGAARLRAVLARDFAPPQLVVASPLTRALETASRAFDLERRGAPPAIALPLASERVYLTSDCGAPRAALVGAWPAFSFVDARETWWYDAPAVPRGDADWRPPGAYPRGGEPERAFAARMASLVAWLEGRPEGRVALVCHWGVIDALIGEDLGNCEAREVPLGALRDGLSASRPGVGDST